MRIHCAVCKKPVDEIEIYHTPATKSVDIEVRCHGGVDRMHLSYSTMIDFGGADQFREGVAFTAGRPAHEPADREQEGGR